MARQLALLIVWKTAAKKLAEKIVIETLDADPLKSVLDPACGSGTFLFQTIKFKIKKLTKKGMKKTDILKHITENVFGFDVHPLAAIISKTNYLLALRDLLKEKIGQITIPVFLSDSIKIPTKVKVSHESQFCLNFGAFSVKINFPVLLLPLPDQILRNPLERS